ncbi:MAG: hypothetical protein HN849_25420, partial [Victivallales bacterium]|nr:hypothetical protein [Victivallales bacterium]
MRSRFVLLALLIASLAPAAQPAVQTLLELPEAGKKDAQSLQRRFAAAHPMEADWLLQDGFDFAAWAKQPDGALLKPMVERLLAAGQSASSAWDADDGPAAWADAYLALAQRRRSRRLARLRQVSPQVVFVKRRPVSPSFFAYTEGQSDAQKERHFR